MGVCVLMTFGYAFGLQHYYPMLHGWQFFYIAPPAFFWSVFSAISLRKVLGIEPVPWSKVFIGGFFGSLIPSIGMLIPLYQLFLVELFGTAAHATWRTKLMNVVFPCIMDMLIGTFVRRTM